MEKPRNRTGPQGQQTLPWKPRMAREEQWGAVKWRSLLSTLAALWGDKVSEWETPGTSLRETSTWEGSLAHKQCACTKGGAL